MRNFAADPVIGVIFVAAPETGRLDAHLEAAVIRAIDRGIIVVGPMRSEGRAAGCDDFLGEDVAKAGKVLEILDLLINDGAGGIADGVGFDEIGAVAAERFGTGAAAGDAGPAIVGSGPEKI